MLKDQALLAKLAEMPDSTKSELAKACGYAVIDETGKERIKYTEFYTACLEAKGLKFRKGAMPKGRNLSYMASIQGNGNLIIGKAYTQKLAGINPGSKFKIALGEKRIVLEEAQNAE